MAKNPSPSARTRASLLLLPILLLSLSLCGFARQSVAATTSFHFPIAQEDVQGAKDHPLLSRMPNSHITEYRKQFDAVDFKVEGGKTKSVEGEATVITYFYSSPEVQPSPLQVIRNYQNALKAIGARLVYERRPLEGDSGETTLVLARDGKEIWVAVRPSIFSAPTHSYQLFVVEKGEMVQEVTADQMYAALSSAGFIALYINFDTGKAELKPEGERTVDEIAKMLKSNAGLRIRIEGHTDNVGSAPTNKTLSENRARTVMSALIARGIESQRLASAGLGSERPIADNRTEEGRAKNRRVELIKQ